MHDRAHVLVQAVGGGGKTFFAAIGGKPLYGAIEVKCRKVVQRLNKEAKVIPIASLADFEKFMQMVQDPRLLEHGFTRVVIDSFTELTEYLPTWLNLGFPLQKQHYGQIQNRAMELMLAVLKSPVPSITICRSVAKEFGDITKVVPGSLGKSAENLPAKCVITAETRHDDEKDWVVDTTPSPYTQRSGLPWVPQIFQGTADEFLALVEASDTTAPAPATATNGTATPAATVEKAPEHRPAPAASAPQAQAGAAQAPATQDAEKEALLVEYGELLARKTKPVLTPAVIQGSLNTWRTQPVERIREAIAEVRKALAEEPQTPRQFNAPDPEKDPKGYQQAAGQMFTQMAEEKRATPQEIPQAVAEFVDAIAAGPGRATPEDITDLQDTCTKLKVSLDSLWAYAEVKGEAKREKDGSKNWFTLSAKFVGQVLPQLKDASKQKALITWLHQKYPAAPAKA